MRLNWWVRGTRNDSGGEQSGSEYLLRELEPLTHDARMRRMVDLGRAAAGDAAAAATIAELERGGFCERLLALQSCCSSRDGAHVLRALSDPSRILRLRAAGLVPLACGDVQVGAALESLRGQPRRLAKMLSALLVRKRVVPVDRFVEERVAAADPKLCRLVPFASAGLAGRHVGALLERGAAADWRRLARRHPALAHSELQKRAEAATARDPQLVSDTNAALPGLAKVSPVKAASLAQAVARLVPLREIEWNGLARRCPDVVADLALKYREQVPVALDILVARLDAQRLTALFGLSSTGSIPESCWFRKLDPERREAVYRACSRGWRDADGCLDPEIVACLPRALREEQGRRHLALPSLSAHPLSRLPYAAFVPWDAALAAVATDLHAPNADVRASALSALVRAARYQRDCLPEMMTLLHAHRREADPVRGALLLSLAELPPGCWKTEHLDSLGKVLRDALDAQDLSIESVSNAQRLLVQLVPFHPTRASQWLAVLTRERGPLFFRSLGHRLNETQSHQLASALLPVFQSWQTHENEIWILTTATQFGRRLRGMEELVIILEEVLNRTVRPRIAESALELLVDHCPKRAAAMIPELLRKDPTWITLRSIYSFASRRRQDLLTPLLGQTPYRGRYSSGDTRWLLPISSGFFRWTAGQQKIFAGVLWQVISDATSDIQQVLFCVDQLAALPAIPPERLLSLVDDERPAVSERALRALGRLDEDQGVSALLEALGDDRARIAAYALGRVIREMPEERALEHLRTAPMNRVSAAKEIVRLIGQLQCEAAFDALETVERNEPHRDVQIAVLRALWSHLHHDAAWEILFRAAASTESALAAMAGRTAADPLPAKRQERLARLLGVVLSHPDPAVRFGVLQRCAAAPIRDSEHALLPGLLRSLQGGSSQEREAAAAAVFATYSGSEEEAHLVNEAARNLLPNRRAVVTFAMMLKSAALSTPLRVLPTVEAVLAGFENDPLTLGLRLQLAVCALTGTRLLELLSGTAETEQLHPGALMTAVEALERGEHTASADELAGLEAALNVSQDERLRRLALAALVGQTNFPSGWTDECLDRLRQYRRDPSILVASAAQFVLPEEELTDGRFGPGPDC